MPLTELPDGAMLQEGVDSYLIMQGRALLWSPAGYRGTPNALDAACAGRRLPARAASEREVFSCNSIVILRLKFARLIATVLSHCRRLGCKCCCDCVHVRDSQIGEDVI
jgi:hypothetical protein